MVIDFTEKFTLLQAEMKGNIKKLSLDAVIKVFYGINPNGGFRLCFLSTKEPPQIDSTKLIRVTHGTEKEQVNWLNFDLIDLQAKEAFYALCGSLTSAVADEKIKTEEAAFTALKNHFYIWRKLLKKESGELSEEMSKGLFGELYFLSNRLAPNIGIDCAIDAWSGPNRFTKDFAYGDTWSEIKTISASAVTIKISSITQLSSQIDGHLIIIRVDNLSEKFDGENTSINGLVNAILAQVCNDEIREKFIEKLIEYGYSIGAFENKRYQIISTNSYLVNSEFPRLLETDIKRSEIAKISYEIIVNTLEKYREK